MFILSCFSSGTSSISLVCLPKLFKYGSCMVFSFSVLITKLTSIPRFLLYFQRETVKRKISTSYTQSRSQFCGSSVLNAKAEESLGGYTNNRSWKRQEGRQREMPKLKYQRTSSFVFCQLYEHQLFISIVGQTGREIKGPAIISSSGDSVRDSCIRDVPVEHGCTPAVHGRLHQQTYHILKHKMWPSSRLETCQILKWSTQSSKRSITWQIQTCRKREKKL